MPTVHVELLPGRSADTKRKIAEGITRVLETEGGARPASVHVVFTEVEAGDWFVAGVPLNAPRG